MKIRSLTATLAILPLSTNAITEVARDIASG